MLQFPPDEGGGRPHGRAGEPVTVYLGSLATHSDRARYAGTAPYRVEPGRGAVRDAEPAISAGLSVTGEHAR